jgi:tRNA-dihydrouridine synthase 1
MTTRRLRPGPSVVAAAQAAATEHERAAATAAVAADAADAAAVEVAPAPPPPRPSTSRAAARAAGQPTPEQAAALAARARAAADLPLLEGEALDAHVARAWARWRTLGAPRYHCAPMVDQSELPFRVLSRRHGAQAAYSPMMAARLFAGSGLYRAEHFTTIEEDAEDDRPEDGGEDGGEGETSGSARPTTTTTTPKDTDRPLFVQFCANDPVHFAAAGDLVRRRCDYVDLNLGCPQRIASRGRYGAYLMDDLSLVRRLVRAGSECLRVAAAEEEEAAAATAPEEGGAAAQTRRRRRPPSPSALLSVKIRLFPAERGGVEATIAYARMLEAAGASLIAVHGRTRAMRDASNFRADWEAIAAVKSALRVPCLANGDVRSRRDADLLLEATGCEGVLSAEPLLRDPALFSDARVGREHADVPGVGQAVAEDAAPERDQQQQDDAADADAKTDADPRVAALKASCDPGMLVTPLESLALCREYLDLCALHPVPMRMMRGHVHKLLHDWLGEHTDLRQRLTGGVAGLPGLLKVQEELEERVRVSGRDYPVPKPSERQLARELERARAREEAIAAQAAEEAALAALLVEEAREQRGEEGGAAEEDQEDAVEAARREMAAMACARGIGGGGGDEEKQRRAAAVPLAAVAGATAAAAVGGE